MSTGSLARLASGTYTVSAVEAAEVRGDLAVINARFCATLQPCPALPRRRRRGMRLAGRRRGWSLPLTAGIHPSPPRDTP